MSFVGYSAEHGNGMGTFAESNSFKASQRRLLETNLVDKSETVGEQFSFEWNIKGYSVLSSFPEILSPILVGGAKSKHKWQLKVVPRILIRENEYTSVYLILVGFGDDDNDSPARKIPVRFQIRVVNSDGLSILQFGDLRMEDVEFNKFQEWGWSEFFLSKDTDRFTVEDSLNFNCRVWLDREVKHELTENLDIHRALSVPKMNEAGSLLASHLRHLLNDPDSADVTIMTDRDSKKLMAHKLILTARSPVFAKMFRTNKRKAKENSVVIKDFESETVVGMLEWMYTGQTRLLCRRAHDLIQIAEKYDLKGLKNDCENVLVGKLRVVNAATMLVLGHLHHAPYLKRRAMELMIKKMDEVVKTTSFKEAAERFNYTGIFVELFMGIAKLQKKL